MPDLSNQSLVVRCINGDRSAWDKFVQRFSRLIFWAIKERLKRTNYHYEQQDLEDIFQDVFVLLWEKDKLRQIRNREKISGWLVMVAANCAINYFRNTRKALFSKDYLPEVTASSDCSAARTLEQEKLHELFEEVFKFLSARERIILKLCYLYDRTHQEIGEILKIPQNTISSIIKRAKKALRERLEKEGFKIF